jgi:hypothetical protein
MANKAEGSLKTKVVIYYNDKEMQKGIEREQHSGWEVVDVSHVDQGWGFFKTCCLGCLFLPLALLGKKPVKFQVTFRR